MQRFVVQGLHLLAANGDPRKGHLRCRVEIHGSGETGLITRTYRAHNFHIFKLNLHFNLSVIQTSSYAEEDNVY